MACVVPFVAVPDSRLPQSRRVTVVNGKSEMVKVSLAVMAKPHQNRSVHV